MPEKWMLEQYQSLPLQAKVGMSMNRIIEWYDHFEGNVCVSFSGGKDSTVLAHLVHDFFPHVPLVFADTGLEYPEIRKFAEKMGAEFVRPKMRFDEVISKYGYPLISKEVAEAIHFARRIVPANKPIERGDIASAILKTELVGERVGGKYVNGRDDAVNGGGIVANSSPETPARLVPPPYTQTGNGLETSRRREQLGDQKIWGGVSQQTESSGNSSISQELSGILRGGVRSEWTRRPAEMDAGKIGKNDQANGNHRNISEQQTGYIQNAPEADGSRTAWRRRNLTGVTPPGKGYRQENSGEYTVPDGSSWAETDWSNWRRKAIEGTEPGFVGNSQFNKKKWLPLCQETQFRISHYCCHVMKKGPMGIYQRRTHRVPYIGTLTEESRLRKQAWLRHGCNAFEGKKPTSQPMSFWLEQDVLRYIWENGLEICSVYGDIVAVDDTGLEYAPIQGIPCNLKCTGCSRTGCIFCGFGLQYEKGETRFQRLARTHPKQYEYCMNGGQWVDNPDYDPAAPEMDGMWKNWNPKKIWVPSKKGLGMRKVFDDVNQIYGKDFFRYE